jgi:hypothetical protein
MDLRSRLFTFIPALLIAAPFLSAVPTQSTNKCSGSSSYDPPFPTTLNCTTNGCQDPCSPPSSPNGEDSTGKYYWCPCGTEGESDCCKLVVRVVEYWSDTVDVIGTCKDCGLDAALQCRMRLQDGGSGNSVARCELDM